MVQKLAAESKPPKDGPGARPVHIGSVEIRGLRVLSELRFDVLPPGDEEQGQWIVVLGENGVGKTTLLRALGLNLTSRLTAYAMLALEARAPFFSGPTSRIITRVMKSTFESWLQGRLTTRSRSPSLPIDVFAYGSMRGNALGGPDRDVPFDEHRMMASLYDSDARLVHAETWLRNEALRATESEPERRIFVAILRTLESLLPGGERLTVDSREVRIEQNGVSSPLATLSDGYLTTLGWTIDLIARWTHLYRDSGKLDENFAKDMPCVVLVDELDLHLHPRWQLDIIPRLRAAFLKTTFIVTTHNPLTIQGARPGEVFILARDDHGKVGITQQDVPPGLDASRLLTGDWFGLASTLDADTLDKLEQHRAMLWAQRPDSDPARLALEAELRARLNGFADTSIERLAHSVAVEVLYQGKPAPRDITEEDRARVRDEVRRRLASLAGQPSQAREQQAPYGVKPKAAPRTKKKPVARAKAKPKAVARAKHR